MKRAIDRHVLSRPLFRRLLRLRRCDSGASAAEFAILVPVLGVLLTGTIDFAQLGNQGLILDAAVRAGAGYAISCAPELYDCAGGITSTIRNYASSLGSSVAVTFPNATAGTPWYPEYCTWDNATSTALSSCDPSVVTTCSGAQCPMHGYVQVQAVWTLPAPLLPLSLMPTSLTRTLTVRIL